MRETSFKLLKELLLLQSAGGGDMLDSSIEMAIEIYCISIGSDKSKFTQELNSNKKLVWGDGGYENFQTKQELYTRLIDSMK